MANKYEITLVPIPLDGLVRYRGKDYTISAKTHRIELDGQSFYMRQNAEPFCSDLLRQATESSLAQIVQIIKPSVPLTISMELQEDE